MVSFFPEDELQDQQDFEKAVNMLGQSNSTPIKDVTELMRGQKVFVKQEERWCRAEVVSIDE